MDWEAAHRKFYKTLVNFVTRRFPHLEDAEDVVMEALMRYQRRNAEGAVDSDPRRVRNYLCRVVTNIAIDRKRNKHNTRAWGIRNPLNLDDVCGDIGDATNEPMRTDGGIAEVEVELDLDRLLYRRLTEDERMICRLRLDGYSIRESAQYAGLSVRATRAHIARIGRKIRNVVEGLPA